MKRPTGPTPYQVVLMEAQNHMRHHKQVETFKTIPAKDKLHHKEITEWWEKIIEFLESKTVS